MQLNEKTKIKRKTTSVFHDDGTSIHILDEAHDEIVTLNATATVIWKKIGAYISVASLVRGLCCTFDISEGMANKDVNEFLSTLLKRNLIKIKKFN